jgi:tRNA threonylcarbamoyladenosine biosynthesis protein TsaE
LSQAPVFSRSASLDEIESVAEDILQAIGENPVLLMEGDLGSGKTTLSKSLLQQSGVNSEVTSPTFNLVNEYRNAEGTFFYHFDLYRIKHMEELSEIGFFEYLDSGYLCLIEWPAIAESFIQGPAYKLVITHGDEKRHYELYRIE